MPLCIVDTNVPDKDVPKDFHTRLSRLVAEVLKKDEQVIVYQRARLTPNPRVPNAPMSMARGMYQFELFSPNRFGTSFTCSLHGSMVTGQHLIYPRDIISENFTYGCLYICQMALSLLNSNCAFAFLLLFTVIKPGIKLTYSYFLLLFNSARKAPHDLNRFYMQACKTFTEPISAYMYIHQYTFELLLP